MTNVTIAKPTRKIMLDKERLLVLDINAFCMLEQKLEETTGQKSLFEAINWKSMGVRDLTLVLWAALMTHNPELTLDEVRSFCSIKKFGEIKPLLDQMVEDSVPPSEPLEPGEVVDEKKGETATKE